MTFDLASLARFAFWWLVLGAGWFIMVLGVEVAALFKDPTRAIEIRTRLLKEGEDVDSPLTFMDIFLPCLRWPLLALEMLRALHKRQLPLDYLLERRSAQREKKRKRV